MINLAGLQGERIYEGEKRLAISAKTPRARTAKGRREKEKRRHACRAERRQFTHVSAASKAEQLNETARQGWREELKKKKKREKDPNVRREKREVNKIRRICPLPPIPTTESASRKLMPAWRETGRDLIERIFAEDDVA